MADNRSPSDRDHTIVPKHHRRCIVCGEPAHLFSPDSEPVCLRIECKNVLAKKEYMDKNTFKRYFVLQSRQIKWNIRQSGLKRHILETQRKKEEKDYVTFLMQKIKGVHRPDPDNLPYAMISKNTRKIHKLPNRRQNFFRKFLSTLIRETFSEFTDTRVNDTGTLSQSISLEDIYPLEPRTCAVCRGVCCTTGGKDAYIKKETILRYMHRHPDQKPKQVLAAYMDCLGKKIFIDSCVYHTDIGCSLPRDMRSDTCNEFLCDTLIELDRLLNNPPAPKGVYLIQYAKENWREEKLDADDIITLLTLDPVS